MVAPWEKYKNTFAPKGMTKEPATEAPAADVPSPSAIVEDAPAPVASPAPTASPAKAPAPEQTMKPTPVQAPVKGGPMEPVADSMAKTAATPQTPFSDGHYLENREPGFVDKIWYYAKKAGMPVEQMRRDVQHVDDLVRVTARGMTFGFSDKITADMSGTSPRVEKARTDFAKENLGGLGTAAELGGEMVTIGGAMKAVPRAFGAAEGMSTAGRLLGMGGSGAAIGAADAAGHDEDVQRGAAVGAAAGLVGGAVGNLAGKMAARFVNNQIGEVAPTVQALADKADAIYETARNAGVVIKQQPWDDAVTSVIAAATKKGYDPRVNREARIALDAFRDLRGQTMTLDQVEAQRKFLNNVIGNVPQDARSTKEILFDMKDALDDWSMKLRPKDAIITPAPTATSPAGGMVNNTPPAQVGQIFKDANKVWGSRRKMEILDNAFNAAENAAAPFDSAIRSQMRKIANAPNFSYRWSAPEKAAILQIVRGDTIGSLMSSLGTLGKVSIGSTGIGAGIGAAMTGGSPIGAAMGGAAGAVAGAGIKGLSSAVAKQGMGDLRYLTGTGRAAPMVGPAGTLGRVLGIEGGREEGGKAVEPVRKRVHNPSTSGG